MDERYLYPADRTPRVWLGDNTYDYMLSQVLASHGCVIRKLFKHYENDRVCFAVDWRRYENGERVECGVYILIPSEYEMKEPENHFGPVTWNDLHLRYEKKDGKLLRPTWIDAYAFGNGMQNSPIGIWRSENSKIFYIA